MMKKENLILNIHHKSHNLNFMEQYQYQYDNIPNDDNDDIMQDSEINVISLYYPREILCETIYMKIDNIYINYFSIVRWSYDYDSFYIFVHDMQFHVYNVYCIYTFRSFEELNYSIKQKIAFLMSELSYVNDVDEGMALIGDDGINAVEHVIDRIHANQQ